MRFVKFLRVCLVFTLALIPLEAKSYDFGITPNQVYNLWLNINRTFLELQKAAHVPDATLKTLESLTPDRFEGKKPADVYRLATPIYDLVAREISPNVLRKYDNWVNDYEIISGQVNNDPTPSMVYVLSTEILNLLVDTYVAQTLSEKPISHFYMDHFLKDKTPDDVFAQVMLFQKRLQAVLPEKDFVGLKP